MMCLGIVLYEAQAVWRTENVIGLVRVKVISNQRLVVSRWYIHMCYYHPRMLLNDKLYNSTKT